MIEKSPCGDCSLSSIEDSSRTEKCRAFVQEVIHQWWDGNPTMELHDVAMDSFFYDREWSEDERDRMQECFDEHASMRCDSLNP